MFHNFIFACTADPDARYSFAPLFLARRGGACIVTADVTVTFVLTNRVSFLIPQFLARRGGARIVTADVEGLNLGQKDVTRNAFEIWGELAFSGCVSNLHVFQICVCFKSACV